MRRNGAAAETAVPPQLARSREPLPDGDGWAYEPKWDGFRALAFVDGDEVELQSRNGKTLTRYFPEVAAFPPGATSSTARSCASRRPEDFDLLGQRIHPAESRVERLSEETPARFVAFDLLAHDDESLLELPYGERRAALEALGLGPIELTPWSARPRRRSRWLQSEEGVIAKQSTRPTARASASGMVKIKRVRTIDAS